MVLVISQFSHNLSVCLNNTNAEKNLKLTQVEMSRPACLLCQPATSRAMNSAFLNCRQSGTGGCSIKARKLGHQLGSSSSGLPNPTLVVVVVVVVVVAAIVIVSNAVRSYTLLCQHALHCHHPLLRL